MSLTGSVTTKSAFAPGTTFAGESVTLPRNYTRTKTWTNGTGAGAANVYFEDTRALADGANETLDLSGSLAGAFGTAVFARVKYLLIVNLGTTTLTVGNATNPVQLGFGATTSTFAIPAGGKFEIEAPTATGWTVTNSTADGLKIANAAGAATTYKIIIAGADA
jgi:hypothetical protein